MNIKPLLLPFLIINALSACSDNKTNNKPAPLPAPTIEGVWAEPGSGQAFEISETDINIYHHNEFGCVAAQSLSFEQNPDLKSLLTIAKSGKLIIDNSGQQPMQLTRLTAKPQSCEVNLLSEEHSALDNFDYFWHSFDDYYAFFELREMDWLDVQNRYRQTLSHSSSPESLAKVLYDIVGEFTDGHVSVTDGQTFENYGSKTSGLNAQITNSPILNGDEPDPRSTLITHHQALISSYLQTDSIKQSEESEQIFWGNLSDDIGYIYIAQMQEFVTEQVINGTSSIDSDIDFINLILPKILNELKDTSAIVVDVRFNVGGYDAVSNAIAKHFNDKEIIIGTKQIENKVATTSPKNITLPGTENAYLKPVYVIAGQETYSAGEVFTLMMSELSHVQVLGEPTQGMLSDAQVLIMPNGWMITLSNEVYKDSKGQVLEAQGILPDVEFKLYQNESLLNKIDPVLEYILSL